MIRHYESKVKEKYVVKTTTYGSKNPNENNNLRLTLPSTVWRQSELPQTGFIPLVWGDKREERGALCVFIDPIVFAYDGFVSFLEGTEHLGIPGKGHKFVILGLYLLCLSLEIVGCLLNLMVIILSGVSNLDGRERGFRAILHQSFLIRHSRPSFSGHLC